ncbi:peptidoglycan editing factor PgeF [Devosia sp. SL43]|uniref:peptidoglycan editing factor PgeF n=1 Tax=Devosia sp. SL43 TaxID=2806348 RepID=UPI001F3B0F1B|nr:peptidoglycan editing factor PgeF [Devosia sp. SL43]UJW86988.1 peptidoglycan editing factor PgeF [Devosia sp. SL43]
MSMPFAQSSGLAGIATLRHGFFGRQGGRSDGEFASNNMSITVGDTPHLVEANRAGAALELGYLRKNLYLLKQVHSATVRVLTDYPDIDEPFEADAMVTNVPALALGILTADCTPILFADAEAGIIGAAHAGWRGAASGICEATIMGMVAIGANVSRIVAAIGPTISGPNYEVGPQFAADLLRLYPSASNRIFVPQSGVEHFDLPGFVDDCIRGAGVATVDRVGGCTYGEPERYFSHRYATHQGTRTGRQVAIIGLT